MSAHWHEAWAAWLLKEKPFNRYSNGLRTQISGWLCLYTGMPGAAIGLSAKVVTLAVLVSIFIINPRQRRAPLRPLDFWHICTD